MNKIGLINFHRANNYGAVLQAYALSDIIKRLGYNPITIDYKNQSIEHRYALYYFKGRSLKSVISGAITYHIRKKKKYKYEDFRSKFLTLYEVTDLFSMNCDIFSKFITGSDQVWNYKITLFDKVYFLNFVYDHKKKNSYAASFGFDRIPDEYLDDYKELLSDFNHISVRETQGVNIIRDLIGREAEVSLDPTLLLSRDEWYKISHDYKNKKNYVLIYELVASNSLIDFAVNLSKKINCEIVYINDTFRKRIKATYAAGIGPQEFLGLFKNAKYVVTNSFHGTAFSINFNIPFFIELQPPPSIANSRLEHILDLFNLRSRQIINGNNDNVFNVIDYTSVNQKLELERQRSLDYLKRILEE
jgi:hypothetical protein